MPATNLTVFIVDDDASVRDSLSLMLGISGYRTALFADAEAFLAAWREDWRGCVVADLRLPGKSGLDIQASLQAEGSSLPVVIVTAHGDVPTARAAFRAHAVDFLEKPFDQKQLYAAIDKAFGLEERRVQGAASRQEVAEKVARLTPREREVLSRVVEGLHAKEIAAALGISPRTVEVHKARIMGKLEVRNVAELVKVAVEASLGD
ncbi:MAG: response regulator [Betaproteobacteria bacterium]